MINLRVYFWRSSEALSKVLCFGMREEFSIFRVVKWWQLWDQSSVSCGHDVLSMAEYVLQ